MDEVIFEITRLGDYQRCAAVDVGTGLEVVVQAPANAALADVRALALRKLQTAMARAEAEEAERASAEARGKARPGKVV